MSVSPPPPPAPTPELRARFLRDVTLPDGSGVNPGDELVKEWEFENPRDAPNWGFVPKLVFVHGDAALVTEKIVPLEVASLPVVSGQRVIVRARLRIPDLKDLKDKAEEGKDKDKRGKSRRRVAAFFRLADDKGNFFGDRCFVILNITDSDWSRSRSQPPPRSRAPAHPAEPSFRDQLSTLSQMGFENEMLNRQLLKEHDGNVQRVIAALVKLA